MGCVHASFRNRCQAKKLTVSNGAWRIAFALSLAIAIGIGCSYESIRAWAEWQAIESVRTEMPASDASNLKTAANTWGEGFFVFHRSNSTETDFPVWLSVRRGASALDPHAKKLTPKVPHLSEAGAEVQQAAKLDGVRIEDIRREILRQTRDDAIRPGEGLGSPPLFNPS